MTDSCIIVQRERHTPDEKISKKTVRLTKQKGLNKTFVCTGIVTSVYYRKQLM